MEVLIAHPGGPWFANKDAGSWSLVKGLVKTGEDDESADADVRRHPGERTDDVDRSGYREVGVVADIGGARALEGRGPGRGVLPVERDRRGAGAAAHRQTRTVEALDDVFACCDQSDPQILVDPTRAERVIALGRVLAKVPNLRLRELAEDDRLTLLRLTEHTTPLELPVVACRYTSDAPGRLSDGDVSDRERVRAKLAGSPGG